MAVNIEEVEKNVFDVEVEENSEGEIVVKKSDIKVKYLILNEDSTYPVSPLAAYQEFVNFALVQKYNDLIPKHISFTENEEAAGQAYHGEITYTKEEEEEEKEKDEDVNNLAMDAAIETESNYIEVPFVYDVRNGRPVVNSAGQPFNPPVMRQELILTLTVTDKTYSQPDITMSGHVNPAPFLGAPAGTVLLESITGSKGEKERMWTRKRKYTYKPSGWATYILDTGTMEIGSNGKLRKILDSEQQAVQEPVKLDGHGHKLADQSSPGVLLGPFWGYH